MPRDDRDRCRAMALRGLIALGLSAGALACDAFEPRSSCVDGCDSTDRVGGMHPSGRVTDMPTPAGSFAPSMDAGIDGPLAPSPCLVPQQAQCACEDGRRGARECIAGHPSGPCACTGPVPKMPCVPGAIAACACGDGSEGLRVCHVDREPGPCSCAGACSGDDDAGCASPDPTCDDAAAWGGMCPGDPVLTGTVAFEGAAYFAGALRAGDCTSQVLQPFWPLPQRQYYGPYDCRYSNARFGGANQDLFVIDGVDALAQLNDAGMYQSWPTPPCAGRALTVRFLDGDRFVYHCGDTVYRSDHTLLTSGVAQLVQATASGQILITRTHATGETLVVFDAAGQTLSTLTPGDRASGRFQVLGAASTTTPGSEAFVLWQRSLEDGTVELLAYRFGADAQGQLLRRVRPSASCSSQLLLPDGTIFCWDADPTDGAYGRIQVWLRDGTEETAWLERDHPGVRSQDPRALLIGPARPKGAAVGAQEVP